MSGNINIGRVRPCTGCGACFCVCPKNAIEIKLIEGFYSPVIDYSKCINCGICKKVCYSHVEISNKKEPLSSYYGSLKNRDVLQDSASGGITTALAEYLIDDEYIIVGCTYDAENKISKHITLENKSDIYKIRGSKYFQSKTFDTFSYLKGLDSNAKVAFFGTPCQVFGLKKMLEILRVNMENKIFIELFCHGVTSPIIWNKYISSKKGVENVLFRTKDYGWHISSNTFVLKNGKRVSTKRLGDGFFEVYYSTKAFNESCYSCECKKSFDVADIRIGDYWGKRFLNNKEGVSCALALSKKGDEVLRGINDIFELNKGDTADILSGQSYKKDYNLNNKSRKKLIQLIDDPEASFKKVEKFIASDESFIKRFKRRIFVFSSNLKNKIWKTK